MSERAILADRGVVSVTGADAEKLLGGLVTNDMARLHAAPAMYAALLAPQGKILFDFLMVAVEGGYWLETARARAPDLAKRLAMYKLRADVAIRDASDELVVSAAWGEGLEAAEASPEGVRFPDPRLAALGMRQIAHGAPEAGSEDAARAYHAHRIRLGVPEGGRDFAYGEAFPHEGLLDQLHGVSFTKGCFVGQEVVSRMQHRTTVRKRVVQVFAEEDLPGDGPAVKIGEAEIGRLGSVTGRQGLALLRIDRVAEAMRDGAAIMTNGLPLRIEVPAFATFEIRASHEIA